MRLCSNITGNGGAIPSDDLLEEEHMVINHPTGREVALHRTTAAASVQTADTAERPDQSRLGRADEPGDTVADDLGNSTTWCRHDGRATGERLDHHHSERLGPSDGVEETASATEERLLLHWSDLADVLDAGTQ
jgi:hypothetical protein